MSQQLIPLKNHQKAITRLPRLLTELPFFYLTKKASALTEPIDFDGLDNQGHPIRWKVSPNFGPNIGAPSLVAHEVWVRLIKPRIDDERKTAGFVPSLIPLGGVRQCLRLLGWSYGGHQAKSLIRAINQIGGAWCEANLWLPSRDLDEDGNAFLRSFHANFSRLSLYAIGSNHLTEEDIRLGRVDFAFDLDDVLYIKLDPVEMKLLETEIDRPIDNEYLFSLSPSARRWYELMAPKFYGVISNAERNRGYCEIRYSWYVQRHHTLKPHISRKRRVQQMSEVIFEHLDMGFVQKVEYETTNSTASGGRADDLLIRYYPGKFAIRITKRITDGLRPVARRAPHRRNAARQQNEGHDKGSNSAYQQMVTLGVSSARAESLIKSNPKEVEKQLRALPFREKKGIRDVGAWLVSAIEGEFEVPSTIALAIENDRKGRELLGTEGQRRLRERHETSQRQNYSSYLRARLTEIQAQDPEAYRLFLQETAAERLQNEKLIASMELRERLVDKLVQEYFSRGDEHQVLDFWAWDAALNPDPYSNH
jgi:hypothetical protein